MKVLVIDNFHHKNMIGLRLLLNSNNIKYKFGNINDIKDYDIIYSPNNPVNTNLYPDKKFIFGPHFSVFPDNKLIHINNINKNAIYIQPSDWARDTWINMNAEQYLPIKTFSFSVEVDKFQPIENSKKNEIFIMFKQRDPKELEYIISFLSKISVNYKLFNYQTKYNENEYKSCLQNAKYGIWIGRHESQGFALEEALSCNIPLLVWDVNFMSQEYGYNYPDIPATVIPYWDNRCGEYFKEKENFEETYYKLINKLDTYKPREYILENLSPEKCGDNFIKLINDI